jgi:hypothetical protein
MTTVRRIKTWGQGKVYASDLNGEFNSLVNSTSNGAVDLVVSTVNVQGNLSGNVTTNIVNLAGTFSANNVVSNGSATAGSADATFTALYLDAGAANGGKVVFNADPNANSTITVSNDGATMTIPGNVFAETVNLGTRSTTNTSYLLCQETTNVWTDSTSQVNTTTNIHVSYNGTKALNYIVPKTGSITRLTVCDPGIFGSTTYEESYYDGFEWIVTFSADTFNWVEYYDIYKNDTILVSANANSTTAISSGNGYKWDFAPNTYAVTANDKIRIVHRAAATRTGCWYAGAVWITDGINPKCLMEITP